MSGFIFGFGLFIAALSIFGLLKPRQLMNAVVHTVNQPWGLAFAVGIRLALGAVFLVSADQVAQPVFITVLGDACIGRCDCHHGTRANGPVCRVLGR